LKEREEGRRKGILMRRNREGRVGLIPEEERKLLQIKFDG
jgi:hypothetical protein